jgi:hypothetical protein
MRCSWHRKVVCFYRQKNREITQFEWGEAALVRLPSFRFQAVGFGYQIMFQRRDLELFALIGDVDLL